MYALLLFGMEIISHILVGQRGSFVETAECAGLFSGPHGKYYSVVIDRNVQQLLHLGMRGGLFFTSQTG